MDGLRPCVFEARHLPRRRTPLPRPEPAPVRHQSYENQQPRQEGIHRLAYGQKVENKARQAARSGSTTEVRHCLSVPTGKPAGMAASGHPCGALRPGQNAPGRQVGRPLSPARVRAMPKRFVVIERPKNRLIRKKAGQHRAKNRRQGQQEGRREVFRDKARGRAGRAGHGVLAR